jgi:hypothetical protein
VSEPLIHLVWLEHGVLEFLSGLRVSKLELSDLSADLLLQDLCVGQVWILYLTNRLNEIDTLLSSCFFTHHIEIMIENFFESIGILHHRVLLGALQVKHLLVFRLNVSSLERLRRLVTYVEVKFLVLAN